MCTCYSFYFIEQKLISNCIIDFLSQSYTRIEIALSKTYKITAIKLFKLDNIPTSIRLMDENQKQTLPPKPTLPFVRIA